jgi:thiol reductant ABC exporter CydD subunit
VSRSAERGVDRRLAREVRAARAPFAVAGVLGVATAFVVVAQAELLALIIARSAVDRVPLARLQGDLMALVAVLSVRALLAGGFELSGRLGALRVMTELRERLARALLIDRPGRRPSERTGELAAAAVPGVDSLQAYFAGYLPSLVLATVVPVSVLIWVVPQDLLAAVCLAATVPILIVFMVLIGKGAQARTRSRWQVLTLLSSHFLDVVSGLETLRAHRREAAQAQTLRDVGDRYRRETMATLRLAFLSALVLELCAMIGTALVAATIGVQLTEGHLTLRAGLTVLLLAPELYGPLRAVGQQFHASADGLAAAEQLMTVLDEPATVAPPRRASSSLTAPDPRLYPVCFDAVSYEYPGRTGPVLKDLNLELAPGALLALVGPSGAGKSTVAALALRLMDPSSGRVSCGGIDLRDVPAVEWQRQAAWVPQRSKLFAGTIAQNIALTDPGAGRAALERAASQAGLDELLAELPDGLQTLVGEGGRRLSAGQAQRLAIARAFLRDPPLVILDEPTVNLDSQTAAQIGIEIERLAQGRTTLLITHDVRLSALADQVVELRGLGQAELAGTFAAARMAVTV